MIQALEVYQSRPSNFYALKAGSTFGPGLNADLKKQLYSENVGERLQVINALVQSWTEKRMELLRLSPEQRELLQKDLEVKRQQGTKFLQGYRLIANKSAGKPEGVKASRMAPAYVDIEECAACNGAVGKKLNLMSK